MFLHQSTVTLSLSTKNSVLVPSACPGIPCASLPSSFEYDVSYNLRYFGFFMNCMYYISSPVSSLKLRLSFWLIISVQLVFLGTCLFSLYQRMRTWLLGLPWGFWFCVQARCLEIFPLLVVLLALLVLLNVEVVPPLEVSQSSLLVHRRPVISSLVAPLEVMGDFLWSWVTLEVSRGEQVAERTMVGVGKRSSEGSPHSFLYVLFKNVAKCR